MNYLNNQLPDVLPEDPMLWVEAWLAETREQATQPNPNAMTLSTVDAEGYPSSRVVLCKMLDVAAAYFVFFTNYDSRKVCEIEANSKVCVNFHWDAFGRQIRVEGLAAKSPSQESDAYFSSRPLGSQLGAWTSDQSAPLESRGALHSQFLQRAKQLNVSLDENNAPIPGSIIPRPENWGGVRIYAQAIELWVDGEHRIHDRARWTRDLSIEDGLIATSSDWSSTRLQP